MPGFGLFKLVNRSYFFDNGIRFTCRRCGHCCTGEPGTIYLHPSELAAIAGFLNITCDELIHRHLYPFKNGYSIGEMEDGRCRFFFNGCTIYPVRPLQCRTYPFWFDNLRSEPRWREVAQNCPGIGSGNLYTKDELIASAWETVHI